ARALQAARRPQHRPLQRLEELADARFHGVAQLRGARRARPARGPDHAGVDRDRARRRNARRLRGAVAGTRVEGRRGRVSAPGAAVRRGPDRRRDAHRHGRPARLGRACSRVLERRRPGLSAEGRPRDGGAADGVRWRGARADRREPHAAGGQRRGDRPADSRLRAMTRRPQQVAMASVAIGVLLVAGKLIVGLLTGSLGILSEAVHSFLDLTASTFTLLAVRTSRKPPDKEHPYGHGRTENLAAFAEGVILVLTALGIAAEAIHRLMTGGHQVDATWYAFALIAATIVIETARGLVLRWVGRAADSAALQADATDRLADVLSSIAVLAGLAGVRAGVWWADAAAALLVSAIIMRAAGILIWRSGDILIDRAPAGAEEKLRLAIARVTGVREVRSVRVRRSGPQLLGDVSIATRRMLPVE